jgi:hypothetical protein
MADYRTNDGVSSISGLSSHSLLTKFSLVDDDFMFNFH